MLPFHVTFSCYLFGDVLSKTTKLNLLVSLQEEVCINFNFISLSLLPFYEREKEREREKEGEQQTIKEN